jgi:hypothetical protein
MSRRGSARHHGRFFDRLWIAVSESGAIIEHGSMAAAPLSHTVRDGY